MAPRAAPARFLSRWATAAGAAALALSLAAGAARAQGIVLQRIVEKPSGEASEAPQPIQPGADWYDQPLRVEGVTRLRILSPESTVAAGLRFVADPARPGMLELRIALYTDPEPLEYRQLGASQAMVQGRIAPATQHRPLHGVDTELAGEAGRVDRIVVQDDYGSALRWSRAGETLVLEAIPPEAGGEPVGAAETWWARRPLNFLDYTLLGGGYTDNALVELKLWDLLAARFNGYFTSSSTLVLTRLVLRAQAWRSRHAAIWAEGGGAFWRKYRADNSVDDEDITWVAAGTGVYRSGDWGAAAHLGYVNGPVVMELYGGWQWTRRIGLFLAWHSFHGSSGTAAGLGIDF